jgi:hypothetical protein
VRLTSRARPVAAAALAAAVTLSFTPQAPAAAAEVPLFDKTIALGPPDILTGKPGDGRTTVIDRVDRRTRGLTAGGGAQLPESVRDARAAQPRAASPTELSTWVVNYDDKFNDPSNADAKEAFQRAVDIWSHTVVSPTTIEVDAKLTSFPAADQLGGAGPTDARSAEGVWFPIALANALDGSDLNGAASEITAEFADNDDIFYYGAAAAGITSASCTFPASSGLPSGAGTCYDFESVVLHELGHGLGFIGSADAEPDDQFVHYGVDFPANEEPFVYDLFTQLYDGTPILELPNDSQDLTDALTSNAVYWNGPEGASADRGREPRLYAPYNDQASRSGFEPGSTYSHLSDGSYPRGDRDSLMTPFGEQGDVVRDPGEVMLGMFRDMGWGTPALPGSLYTPLPDAVPVLSSTGFGGGATRNIGVAGRYGVPADATAVLLNLTAASVGTVTSQIRASALSRPNTAVAPVPTVANLYLARGQTRDGLATVPLGGGAVRLRNDGGGVRVSAAVVGYFRKVGSGFHPLSPSRVMDTRTGTGVRKGGVGRGGVVDLQVAGRSGVPASGATAVVLNLTAVTPTTSTQVQAYRTGASPTIGQVHTGARQSATNLVTVPIGSGGKVRFRNVVGATHLVADIAGWYGGAGYAFRPTLPQRVAGPSGYRPGVPRDAAVVDTASQYVGFGVPPGAQALVLDLVGSAPTTSTYATAYPTGGSFAPTVLSLTKGLAGSAPTLTRVSTTGGNAGKVRLRNATGSTSLALDVFGYFA